MSNKELMEELVKRWEEKHPGYIAGSISINRVCSCIGGSIYEVPYTIAPEDLEEQ